MSAELQESHEQRFPPAEDDGDPAHEQRVPGDPSAKSAGVSTGDKQRGVRLGGCPGFGHDRSDRKFLFFMFVLIPERNEKSRSSGVPPATPTSPAASQTTGAPRSTK